jgi:hypothetical protein
VSGPLKTKRGSAVTRVSHSRRSKKTSATAEAWGQKGHAYKPLPTQFRHHEFDYRQIAREGDGAIYEQTWKGNEQSAAFEVIRIRKREGFQIDGRFVGPAEVYPNSEAWCVDGWTYTEKEAAFRKLREVVGRRWG